jgi:hypothetical protein
MEVGTDAGLLWDFVCWCEEVVVDLAGEACGVALFLGGMVGVRSNWRDRDGRAVGK